MGILKWDQLFGLLFLLIINTKILELKLRYCAFLPHYKNTLLLIVEIISVIKKIMLIILLHKATKSTSTINLVIMGGGAVVILQVEYTTILKIN